MTDDIAARLPVTVSALTVEELGDQVRFVIRVGDRINHALLTYDEMLELTPRLFGWCVDQAIARRKRDRR